MIAKKKMFAAVVVFSWLVAGVCTSAWAGDENSRYDFSKVEAAIQKWVDDGNYPGAAIRIVRKDQIIYEKCFNGYTPETTVYIASAGKWLAAATVAAVCDEGKLSWDDPVSKWLPEFKDVKGKATLRQLFAHTSGFPAYHQAPEKPDAYQTLEEAVAHIAPLPPAAAPGERWGVQRDRQCLLCRPR